MKHQIIMHPEYGRGVVRSTRYGGLELEVTFDGGLVRWVRREHVQFHAPPSINSEQPSDQRLADRRSHPRRIIEALRMGIVPEDCVDDFTFGRDKEIDRIKQWLQRSDESTLLLVGGYGTGKTHLLNYARSYAVQQGFAAAFVEMDTQATPFSKPKRVYSRLVESLRFRNNSSRGGFRDLIQHAFTNGLLKDHPYFRYLHGKTYDERLWEWIEAREAVIRPGGIDNKFYTHLPGLYDHARAANIFCHLLSTLGWVAQHKAVGLKGLVLIFDEAETLHASRSSAAQQRSYNFLEALIATARGDRRLQQPPCRSDFVYAANAPTIPFLYNLPSGLKLLFAFTSTDEFLPKELSALEPLCLDTFDETGWNNILHNICAFYAQAYGIEQRVLHPDALCDYLDPADCPPRMLIKGYVEVLDLLRFHPVRDLDEILQTDSDVFAAPPRRLQYTWRPFFSRFGRLTPIQAQAIPKILDGINTVVAAPTASGKTEAVVGPVAERCMAERWSPVAVVYIVPTRALANDTLVRIEGPLGDMGLTTALKHGDKPSLPVKKPDWLITTPESLDSLIGRRPNIFATLRTIILDEIHLLDNTYRGDQLRLLLARLQKLVAGSPFATHLLSATLSNPGEIAARYASSCEVVTVTGQRGIDYHMLHTHAEIRDLARAHGWKKLLYFCNRRPSVEKVADELSKLWEPYPVVAHHGKLDRKVREEAEQVMKESRVAIGVATATLEIGIDIGDIDLVVLAEPPWSIASLLQRVGRGNRRSGRIQVAALVSSDDEETLLKAMFDTAAEGTLPVEPYVPDRSVVVQQTLSYLFQRHKNEGTTDHELLSLLTTLCTEEEARKIVSHLRQEQWIQQVGRKWYPDKKLLDAGEEGRIHSNVPEQGTFKVMSVETGQEIGSISGTIDQVFLLAGRAWQIVAIHPGRIQARRFSGKATAASFGSQRNTGGFHYLLPPEYR